MSRASLLLIAALLCLTGAAFLVGRAGADRGPSGEASHLVAPLAASDGQRQRLLPAEAREGERRGLLPPAVESLLLTDGPLRYGGYRWSDEGVAPGPLRIWIDLRTQIVSVFRGGHEIGTAVILYGDESMPSPTGQFPILSKVRDYHSKSYDAPMPYSLFLTEDGVAIHGSDVRPRGATHGCIGLPIAFARRLYDAASTGDKVHIVRSPAASRRVGKAAALAPALSTPALSASEASQAL